MTVKCQTNQTGSKNMNQTEPKQLNRNQGPIGIFDSGVGGLTVTREIMRQLPCENLIYFGDTARVPYGSKSKQTIVRYSTQIVNFLRSKNVKAIVIACNTASALALDVLEKEIDIPIIIYEKETNTYYRYAIELDGDIWHKKIKGYDIEKNNVIMKTDWKLIRIWFESKEKTKEKIEAGFRKIADDVCEIISSDMKGELEEWSVRIIDSF